MPQPYLSHLAVHGVLEGLQRRRLADPDVPVLPGSDASCRSAQPLWSGHSAVPGVLLPLSNGNSEHKQASVEALDCLDAPTHVQILLQTGPTQRLHAAALLRALVFGLDP